MPSFPLVDTHVHFLDIDRHRYPEIAAAPKIHRFTYRPISINSAAVDVDKLVFVDVAVARTRLNMLTATVPSLNLISDCFRTDICKPLIGRPTGSSGLDAPGWRHDGLGLLRPTSGCHQA